MLDAWLCSVLLLWSYVDANRVIGYSTFRLQKLRVRTLYLSLPDTQYAIVTAFLCPSVCLSV